jgi:hypothetical protein
MKKGASGETGEEMTIREKLEKYEMLDVGILLHSFTPHMRDYDIITQVGGLGWDMGPGRYLYRFTHCTEAHCVTTLTDTGWRESWSDTYIDYEAWVEAGQPEGFVWGVQWSLAYPGLTYIDESESAGRWSSRLGTQMHEVNIETEAFCLNLIFHDVRVTKLDNDTSVIDRAIIPLS